MNVQRQTERVKVIHENVKIFGTDAAVTVEYVVPDGMIMEVRGLRYYLIDASQTNYLTMHTLDRDGEVVIYWAAFEAIPSTGMVSAPSNGVGNASSYLLHHHEGSTPIVLKPGDALCFYYSANLGAADYVEIGLDYVLKPYSFNLDNLPPT